MIGGAGLLFVFNVGFLVVKLLKADPGWAFAAGFIAVLLYSWLWDLAVREWKA